jgi:hypothetical protein
MVANLMPDAPAVRKCHGLAFVPAAKREQKKEGERAEDTRIKIPPARPKHKKIVKNTAPLC